MPPKEILASPVSISQTSPINGLAELNSVAYSPSARLALKAYAVSPGSEYRYLAEIAIQPNVIATSLNYLGRLADANPADLLENSLTINSSAKARWFLTDFNQSNRVFEKAVSSGLRTLNTSANQPLVAVVDPSIDHCKRVVSTILETYNIQKSSNDKDLAVLALYMNGFELAHAVDLWTFSNLVLALCDTGKRIAALNLSVDIGVTCGKLNGMPQPLGAWMYSFPLFERLLEAFISAQLRNGYDPPVIFAAAGNNRTDQQQWRLAYPASLPNVIAVTHLSDSARPNNERVDLPAVSPLKPCFAEFISDISMQSTSFACAALVGKWAYWDHQQLLLQQRLGQFDKLALLLLSSQGTKKLLSPEKTTQPWVPCVVQQFTPGTISKTATFLFQGLLQQLNQQFFGYEFLITGSAAFVSKMCSLQNQSLDRKAYSKALSLLGDIDILYAGPELEQEKVTAVRSAIKKWLNDYFDLEKEQVVKLQIHSLKEWSGTLHLLQCIIPAACLFLTASGIIDPWQQQDAFWQEDELSFYPPPQQAWTWNPQFRSGASGLAHALMIWINLNLIRSRLQSLYFKQSSEQSTAIWLTPETLQNHPVLSKLIKKIINQEIKSHDGTSDPALFTSSQLQLLFGQSLNSMLTDRLTHRLKRTAQLIDNQDTDFWRRAKEVSEWLKKAWKQHLTESTPVS